MANLGWDLPPGCRVSDIPGNRPEDIRLEELCEALTQAMTSKGGYTHNLVSAKLRVIAKEFGRETANEVVKDFGLTRRFGIKPVLS
jgi:hypothetical protein